MSDQREAMEKMRRQLPEPKVVVTLAIRLHEDGAMSVMGPIGDKEFCRKLLEEAWASINRQAGLDLGLVVPARDVDSQAQEAYTAK